MFPPNPEPQDPRSEPQVPSPAASPPGRPRTLDETKLREICALVSAGCGIIGAARYVDCAASTIRREALRNPNFNERLRRAYLSAELTPLQALRQAATKYWRAAAWLLERGDVQRYGKQDVRHVKPEQLQAFIEGLSGLLNAEIQDPEVHRRITDRLAAWERHAEKEFNASHDPFPKPRRKRRNPPK